MQKTYKRYASLGSFGVVGSTRSNLLMIKKVPYLSTVKKEGTRYCVTAALENVIIWDVRRGEKVRFCLLYTSPSPRDKRQSRMPSSA